MENRTKRKKKHQIEKNKMYSKELKDTRRKNNNDKNWGLSRERERKIETIK